MLLLGVPAVTMAQGGGASSGPFADVPADHWAYQAVDTLQKAGIVIGYPDGTYGGKRAMTRYEFAVAIARLLPLINNAGGGNYATKDDLEALRQDLQKKLEANSDAIDALRKLVNEFQPELEKLGQDVAAVNDRLNALEARVAAVEEEQRRVRFTGALNLIAKGESITKGGAFMDQNGQVLTADKHLLRTTDVYHDFLLGIRGKVSDTATANVMLDFGNYLSAIGNTAAVGSTPAFANIYDTAYNSGTAQTAGGLNVNNEQTTVWEANLEAPVSLGPLGGADLVVGRFGNQWTRYTLQQIDADVYTYLYQTDSGNIPTDGVKLNFNLGGAKLNAWAGQMKAIPFAQPYGGTAVITPGATQFGTLPGGLIPTNHAAPLTQGAGVRAIFGNPNNWVLGLSLEQFAAGLQAFGPGAGAVPTDAETGKKYGVLTVYGVDFNGAIPFLRQAGVKVDLNLHTSPTGSSTRGFNDSGSGWRYTSTDDQVGVTFGALSVKGGYQYVGPDYTAPGYWGRVGAWINPTNVEGGVASAKYVFSPRLSLNADYEGYKAAYGGAKGGGPINSPLQQGDKLTRYQIGLGYGLTSNYNVDLGYEEDNWDLKRNLAANPTNTLTAAGKPTQQWITIGVGHNFNKNASVKLEYQIARYKDKGTGFNGATGDADGNVAVGQFQVKF
jgi:hypothetical protein